MDPINIALMGLMALMACSAVYMKDLIRSALSLAFMSALLAVLLFRLDSPYAGVFELSVVAGLITVLFVSTIALTSSEDTASGARWPLPAFLLVLVLFGLIDVWVMRELFASAPGAVAPSAGTFGMVFWGSRALDLMGQVAVIFGGVFGVLVLLREDGKEDK